MIETMTLQSNPAADLIGKPGGTMRRYWTCQLLGWIGYSLIGITINLLAGASLAPLLVGHVIMIASGIGLTHYFRSVIRRRRAPEQPFRRIWPTLVVGSIGIGLALTALVVIVNVAITNNKWDAVSVVGLSWGMLLASGVWTLLYVRFSERRAHADRESHLLLSLREAQLRTLESQINPHFLFNCLNSIRALVEIEPARAQDMLTRLSNVLRNSLRHDEHHTAALADEMESVRDYLALETVRFGDRLSTTVSVEEAAAGLPVPTMVIQTLVENAIKLRERLALLYGDRASLRLEQEGGRVKAMVAIPAWEG